MERADQRGALLGAAPTALQLVTPRGRRDLGGKDLAAFPPGNEPRVTWGRDGSGAARESLLLRRLSRRNPVSQCHEQLGVESATLGHLGGGHAAGDSLRKLLDRRRDLSVYPIGCVSHVRLLGVGTTIGPALTRWVNMRCASGAAKKKEMFATTRFGHEGPSWLRVKTAP